MKIAIFGSTGRTGKLLVAQALENGHQLDVLARDPAKLEVSHEKLTVIQGDAKDAAVVEQVIEGTDAVISALGPTKGQQPFTVSKAVENILAAMQKHNVKRLVFSAGAGVGDPQDEPGFMDKVIGFLLKLTARAVYEDMEKAVQLVRSSKTDWTIARAPMLTDDPGTGDMEVGYLGKGVSMRLSRADLAAFMLASLQTEEHTRKAPVVSS